MNVFLTIIFRRIHFVSASAANQKCSTKDKSHGADIV